MKLYLGRYRYCKYDVIECKNLLNNTREYLMTNPDLYYFSDYESNDTALKEKNSIEEVIRFSKNIKNNSLSFMINALSLSYQEEIKPLEEKLNRVNIFNTIICL